MIHGQCSFYRTGTGYLWKDYEPERLLWAPMKRSYIVIARGHRRGGIVPVPSADW